MSIPSISGVGNLSPVSMPTILPPYSITVMFLPISPSPPSGRIRSFFEAIRLTRRHRDAGALESRANDLALGLGHLDQRQAQPPRWDRADHRQRRLDRHRV